MQFEIIREVIFFHQMSTFVSNLTQVLFLRCIKLDGISNWSVEFDPFVDASIIYHP